MNQQTKDVLFGLAVGALAGAFITVLLVDTFPPPALAEARQEIAERRQAAARNVGAQCVIDPGIHDCREVCDLMATEELETACQAGMSSGYLFNTMTTTPAEGD